MRKDTKSMLLHLSTAVWGPWHIGMYLNANLPSLLTVGNLPSLAAQHKVVYRIFTSTQDIPLITASNTFQRARQIVRIEIVPCDVDAYPDPITAHHALWRRSTDEARDADAMVVFIPPDVIWSNCSLGHVGALITQGKRIIFGTYIRAVSETCMPAARGLFLDKDAVTMNAPPRALVRLALAHIHPLALTYLRDSDNFPTHPEMILWRVPGDGFLARYLTREMFAYDPKLVRLNAQALPADDLDPIVTHYITDSDDLFSISLTPRLKDLEWYIKRRRFEAIAVANWWLSYDSPANDLTTRPYFTIHLGPFNRDKWRRVEIESNTVIRRLVGTREILRAMKELAKMGYDSVGHILALALTETKLASCTGSTEPMSLFIPLSGVIDVSPELLKPGSEKKLINTIRDHCSYGKLDLLPGKEEILKTPTGKQRELTYCDGQHFIDGVKIKGEAFLIGKHRAYLIETVLPSLAVQS